MKITLRDMAQSTHKVARHDRFENGIEYPRASAKLATQLPQDDRERLAPDYLKPGAIDIDAWRDREAEGILYVPKADEMLYRLRDKGSAD